MLRRLLPAVLAAGLLSASSPPAKQKWDALSARYYAEYPAHHPTTATELGLHEHDAELELWSAKERDALRSWTQTWQRTFAREIDPKLLPPADAADYELATLGLESSLVELDGVQGWKHRPDAYPGLASRSLYAIIKRDFAPAEKRLESAIAREEKIPELLANGKKNLQNVAKVAVQIALDELPGIIDFFDKDVPLAFSSLKDAKLRERLQRSTAATRRALEDYQQFLEKELLPKANGSFAIGEELFRKKLHADEMIDTPLDELLRRGELELRRLQLEFRAVAKMIDPKKSYVEVQAEMQKDHGSAASLIADTQARLAGLRKFLVDHAIVSLPSEVMPRVEETPPFMRATTLASMETPGPFETRATEAYYNVTLPDKAWTAAQVEDFLRGAFSRPTIDVTSIHEAFPGHYVQFLWLGHVPSRVRKVESVSSNAEGWAHYCEQMMLDEGYGAGDHQLKLAQLQDALLRAARYVVGIRMHTRGMSFDEGVAYFEKEGLQSAKVAEMETRRGTEDPTYLYYTLGKLEILRLRDDYKKKWGSAYSLRKFHDAFLAEGAMPLPLVRRALLAN